MEIKYVADCPQHLEITAFWCFREWHELYPDESVEDVIEDYKGYLNRGKIPTALVAVDENDTPLGTACFLAEDELPGFEYLTPWIGAVYVDPPYRSRKIGRLLLEKIFEDARKEGFEKIHIWTHEAKNWYSKMGWFEINTTIFGGYKVSVMQYNLK